MEIKVKQHSIPGIGMRIIKSATAVAICFLVDRFRGGVLNSYHFLIEHFLTFLSWKAGDSYEKMYQ